VVNREAYGECLRLFYVHVLTKTHSNMKRNLLLILGALLPLMANAYDAEIDGIYYNFSGEEATVTYKDINSNYNSYSSAVVIPESVIYNGTTYSVTSIGSFAFVECNNLTSITIGSNVTSIGGYAFEFCSGLTSVTIPNSVTSIGDGVFWRCTVLTSVTISNRVTSIGERAFFDCIGLTSITIPNSVTSIGNSAFCDCSSLTSVSIPNSVTSIGDGAFANCIGLTSVNIPNNVTYIGQQAFYGCSGLASINIPNNVTSIGNYVFSGCSSLTSVTIPNSVTGIGKNAFADCSGLTSITIPNSVTNISNYAFGGCSSLTSVTIGSNVTSIGDQAFSGTKIKKTIWLTNTPPSGYTNASGAINYVSNEQYTSLQNKVVYPYLSSMFEVEGIMYVPVNPSERTCDVIDCVYDETAAKLNIPSTVSYRGISMNVHDVKPYLCYNNKFIETLSCENTGNIADYAFCGCTNMTNLSLGEDVSAIGNYAFQNCSSLPSVNIPNAIATLGGYALSGCSSLTDITIPKSVSTIGDYAFQGCTALKDFIIDDRENELSLGRNGRSPLFTDCPLDSVYIGGKLSYNTNSNYGYSPFYRNTALRTVVISDKETEISPNEFYGCTNLQNFTIGDGVKSFGDWAFSGCSSLKSLSFGSQLNSIGKEAFSDCSSVTRIVSKAVTPPTCGNQALDDINKWECTIYVPKGSLTSYQGAEQWKEFFFIIEGADLDVEPDLDKKCAKPTISYKNGELAFSCETEGVQFTSTITDNDIKTYYLEKVELCVTYTISVYATKAGYEDSEVATATLCWIDVEPQTEGIIDEDAVAEVKAVPVLIQTQGGNITIQGAAEGTPIAVYDTSGKQYGSTISEKDRTTISTSLQPGTTAIVKIGEKAVKVVTK
jgi:hypothetical protein